MMPPRRPKHEIPPFPLLEERVQETSCVGLNENAFPTPCPPAAIATMLPAVVTVDSNFLGLGAAPSQLLYFINCLSHGVSLQH